jgi:hypothetical protein
MGLSGTLPSNPHAVVDIPHRCDQALFTHTPKRMSCGGSCLPEKRKHLASRYQAAHDKHVPTVTHAGTERTHTCTAQPRSIDTRDGARRLVAHARRIA